MTREEIDKRYEGMTLKELNDEYLELLEYSDHVEGSEDWIYDEIDIVREYISKK